MILSTYGVIPILHSGYTISDTSFYIVTVEKFVYILNFLTPSTKKTKFSHLSNDNITLN